MRRFVVLLLLICCLAPPAFALNAEPAPPQDPESFAFLYFGDIQVVESAEADFAAWETLARDALSRNPGIAFALQGGDIVESGIDEAQWRAFFAAADRALGELPFFPTNGNHESNFLGGKPERYLELFDLPQNGPAGFPEEFYSFDYGNAHVLVLNSWIFSGEQNLTEADFAAIDAWIADDLAAACGATWRIAVTHVPIYAVHSDLTSDKARAHWAPIFEKYGLDLCFVGHQHVYSRLKPLTDGAEDAADGVTYIMGNSGRKFYDSADESLAARTLYNAATYQLVRVDGGALTVQSFDAAGEEADFIALTPRGGKALTRGAFVAEFLPDARLLGYGDGETGLDKTITNEQTATLLWRKAGSPAAGGGEAASPWARAAWAWATAAGLFESANPKDATSRALAAYNIHLLEVTE
ncbi:MAG: metallophosphoesterase [Clostridiales Family XIII bacterium]|jgi:hypothetical protein|nr:metallophosphoesterase [Clostridiales Family XIII bacterium]